MPNGKSLIITGMHRSATSLVAQAYFRAGLYLGDKLGAATKFNPDGYYEDIDIVAFHDELLAANNASWHAAEPLKKLTVSSALAEKAAALLNEKFAGHSVWGWKDPRSVLFLDFWREALPDAKWIFVYRDPAEVAWSLLRRGDLKIYSRRPSKAAWLALNLWTKYNRAILAFASRHKADCLMIRAPQDLQRATPPPVNTVVCERWAVALNAVDFRQVYNPSLIQHSPPGWLRNLARFHADSRAVARGLNTLHDEMLLQHSGSNGSSAVRTRDLHTICVIAPDKAAYAETHIRDHIQRLPANVKFLYGGFFPTHTQDDKPLLSPALGARLQRAIARRGMRLTTDELKIRAFQKYLRSQRVEVVLAEYGTTGAAVMDFCRDIGVPFVVEFLGFDAYMHATLKQYSDAYQRMFTAAAAFVVLSRDMERQLIGLGAPRKKVFCIPPGVDPALFAGSDPSQSEPLFVATGRFVDKKAPHLTLLAFQKVLAECPSARLVMVGDGPLLEACRQMALSLGLAHATQLPGARPYAEVAATMRQARAFVQHSLRPASGDSEGLPRTVLEAGASGLPVVATRHAGILDVVVEAETGFLVAEGDVDGMAERMIRLVKDPTLAGQLGRAARQRVSTEFTLEKSIHALWAVLERAITPHGLNA